MLKVASDPIDVQDFQFKLQCRLKIFNNAEGILNKNASNLIASASRFGLLFVGCNSPQFKVIRFASVESYSSPHPVGNYSRREVTLPSNPQHISINCDHTILSVVIERDNCPVVILYDVKSFLSHNITILNEIRLSTTQGVKILAANWHPTVATIFTDCKTDGSLGVYELKGKSVEIKKLPAEATATCFCWSPKGKQIAVGSKDGKLTHYKPDLKAVKVINTPPFEVPHSMISVQWISTFQFIGIFKPLSNSEDQCSIISIDAPKAGNPTFTNFYDICYSNGNFRSPQFYMIFEPHWNILIVASSNSMEVGVLALSGDSWVQWTLPDSARAELPLDENREETYPLGIAIDTSSVKPVPWGESSLQPTPSLLLLSHQGIMCCFKIINLKEGTAGINSPPENLTDLSGSGIFTTGDITVSKPVLDNSNMPPQNTQPPAVQNISEQSSSKQVQKEIKPIQNMFGMNSVFQNNDGSKQTPQIKFQTQIVDSHSSQRALIPNVSQSVDNASSTNLFGGQVTITPANYKELSSKSMTSTKGSILIKSMNPAPSKLVTSDVPVTSVFTTTKSTDQHIVSLSTGEPQTQHKVIIPASVNQVSLRNVSSANQPEIEQEKGEDMEKILNHMIQMECAALEKELKIILFRGKNIRINLDPQIMDIIVNQTRVIDDFIVELIETSESQSSEIHVLKQNTVQSWAWLEEAKSRLREYQSEELSALLKSKPLDSVSEKHLYTLIQMEYYLDSQLSQAHKALDEQWDKFQEYCRKVNRVQLPTMEAIFQTMVKQNAILQKHDVLLKYIASQIRGKKRIGDQISLFNPLSRNRSLEDSFQNLKLQPEDIYQIYYKKVMNRVKPIPQNKSKQLRRILQNRDVSHVKVNSQVPKSILQRTPEKRDTSIFVHMTPTAKQSEKPAKTLNFYQSTPLNITSNPTTQIPKNSALSAFASTNTAITSAKSSSIYMSTSGTESGKDNVINMRSDKGFHAALVKTTEHETGNFSFNSTPKSTHNVEESNGILKEKPGSTNFGDVIFRKEHSTAASTSLLGLMLQSKSTFSQSDTKPLLISTKSNTGTRNENPASCDILRSSSDINIEQSSTSNSASQSIFSSAFSKLAPSISTTLPASTTPSKSTVAFGVPNSSSLIVKSTEKSVESSCPPASTKLNLSSSTITVSTSTKSSFFTPITSGHLNIPSSSQQVPIVNSSSSKPSAFSPLIMPQSNINNLSTSTSVTTSTTGISIFGKPLIVNSTSSSSSTSSQPTLSTPQQNTSSTQLKPISTPNDSTAGLSSTMSIFGKSEVMPSSSTGGSSSFSFLSGIKSAVSSSSTSQVGSNISNTTRTEISTGNENALKPLTSQHMLSDSVSTSVNACPTSTNNIQISNTSTSSSIFGTANTTTTQIFGTTVNSSNIFGPKTTTSTIFTSTSNSGSGIFSANMFSPQTTSASQIFSSSSNTTSSIFSTKSTVSPITPSTASSIFGSVSTTSCSILSTSESSSSKTVQSKFNTDTNSSPFSSAGSIFGGSVSGVTSASSNSLFSNTAVTNNKSIFNNMVTSNQQTIANDMGFVTSSSVVTTASTSSTSIFGNVAVSASPFGLVTSASLPFNASTTSSASVFGGSISFGTPPTSASTSSFGSFTSPFGVPSTSASIFGSSTTSSSLFGNGSSSAGSNNFGTTPTSSATPFASTSTNTPFGKPVFGQPFSTTGFNTTQTTSPSVFGQSMSGTTPIFGNVFGATTTSSTFGSAPFGTTSSGDNSSLFGSSKNIFGGSNTDNSSGSFGFGSLNVGTSSQNQEQTSGSATKSPFGGGSFSNSSTTGSIFGTSSFGSTSGGSIFGQSTFASSSNFGATPQQSGPFTGGAGSVSQAGFGTAPAFQKPAGFGTQSPFGGSPAFGTAPTFGGAPAFGNTSTFGSPNKVFGSASPAGVFGTNSEQSSGFGNLANQNTIGFGNLAQNANNPGQNSSFSGSSSFSNWR
ncbi:hypothetical protein WA026_006456 [Henosepilachna vigintioctopunctata]|uniref:Nucleoporin Nup159/Nup146 N-terminal domain-containing protein n=1 Tax=Henosepilachna vigintioctopunctata TaxID=420089 RepID=A0AAW1U6W9_9CUCU